MPSPGTTAVFKPDVSADDQADTHVPWPVVDDLRKHLEHAVGPTARSSPKASASMEYRAYPARDPDGYRWTIA